jgi:amino acid adenylation domain-containing protein
MGIPRRPRSGPTPLSFAQSRWWFLNQLEPETTALHNWARVTRWQGPLDQQALQRSLVEIVRRHEVLRTRFSILDGAAVQEVMGPEAFRLQLVDLSAIPVEQRLEFVRRYVADELRKPFDLYRGPLFRATLLKLDPEEYVLMVVLHHSISDGWSMQIVFRELATLYSAFSSGQSSPLPELAIQYGDYAAWQREQFRGELLERELAYWRERLRGRPGVLELPTDRPRPSVQTYRGDQVSFTLPKELVEGLTELGRRERATLFMVLLAGFKALLWRYSGQSDLLVGVPIAGRNRLEVEGLIGCFANALTLRTDLSGNPSFRELLARVRSTALGAYAHHDLPFEKLVEELQPERSARHHPIFQVMFNFRDFPPAWEIPGVCLEDMKVERGTALFDLSLALVRGPEGITCGVGYSTDLFDAGTVTRLGSHYRALLEGVVAEPDRLVSEVSLWSDAERQQVIQQWNATARDYQPEACIHQLFERQAVRTPSSLALLSENQRVTYGELNRRANQLARYLARLGVGPEVRVGLCLERSVEMVVGVLAVLKAGGAYVPLDPACPKERLEYMLRDSLVSVLLVEDRQHADLAIPELRVVGVGSDQSCFAAESGEDLASGVASDNLAYVMYTSGSTGRPKGVMVAHRSVVNHLRWRNEYFPLTPADRGLQKASLSFDDSVWEIFEPLLAGAQLVLAPPAVRADSAQLVRLIAERSVTTACFVPSLLQVVLEEPELENCVSLRRVTTGGESLSVELQDRFFSRLQASLHNGYGPTEATISATFWTCQRDGHYQPVPIGQPIANTSVYVLDPQLQPVPIGVPGELCIGGVGLARGYHGRPGLTADRFVPDPFGQMTGARLYRTGDRARYRVDGTLEFLGRFDDQIKLRGNRVELGEVEAVIGEHPAVRQSVVLARRDRSGQQTLVGYVVPQPVERSGGAGTHLEHLQAEHLSQWRARYEEIYNLNTAVPDLGFDTTGWISSYTDREIPQAEMREWVSHTVERILHLEPRRVLEIGCGTGLLLLRIAPHCESYVGTDFSPTVLRSLQQQVDEAGLSRRVKLLQRESSDFSSMGPASVDVVVINSVTQYLPSIEHLVRVIEGAVRVLTPGGRIFIGDVRNFDLLGAFHTSVELFRASDAITTDELRERVSERIAAESELAISPAFFSALSDQLPSIEQVEISLKRGHAMNELTRFRYDVTLRLQSFAPTSRPAVPLTVIDWEIDKLDFTQLRSLLQADRSPAIYLRQVPNSRVLADARAMELLDGPELRSVAELRQELQALSEAGLTPEEFWTLGAQLGYLVEVTWLRNDSRGRYDVLLWRSGLARPTLPRGLEAVPGRHRPWGTYANQPFSKSLSRSLVSELRDYLSERLPDYMIPQAFVLLNALPLTPSGKIDRGSLPEPASAQGVPVRYQPPRTPSEQTIARIWALVLKLDRVGIHDNFFELGGHSLLATQAMSRIRQAFRVDLPLRTIFETPTVASLAAAITQRTTHQKGETAERLLQDLDQISDEEAERLLAAEAQCEDA